MPTNLAENALSALKVGNDNVTAAYVGNSQIFPNTTELTSWDGWDPMSQIPAATTSWNVAVYGDIGATYSITGSNGAGNGTGTINQAGKNTLSIPISSNDTCGAAVRNPVAVIAATGDTTLATGFGSTSSTTSQAGGPANIVFTGAGSSITVQNTVQNNITIGSQQRFGVGSKWTVTYTYGGGTYNPAPGPPGYYAYAAVPNIRNNFFITGGAGITANFNNITEPAGMVQLSTDSNGTSGYQRWNTSSGGYTNAAATGNYVFEYELTYGSITSMQWTADVYLTIFGDICGSIATGTVQKQSGLITTSNPNG